MQRTTMRALVVGIAVLVTALVGAAPRADAAAISGTATGTFTGTATSTLVGTVGGVSYYSTIFTTTYSGGLTGTVNDIETDIVRANGSWIGDGTEICASCTLGGRRGGYVAQFRGSGPNWSAGLPYSGGLIFTRGTGGLAGLQGGGPFWQGSAAARGSYAYAYYLPS
jgi:hypothetical protein